MLRKCAVCEKIAILCHYCGETVCQECVGKGHPQVLKNPIKVGDPESEKSRERMGEAVDA